MFAECYRAIPTKTAFLHLPSSRSTVRKPFHPLQITPKYKDKPSLVRFR
jgi:hypothetical protein